MSGTEPKIWQRYTCHDHPLQVGSAIRRESRRPDFVGDLCIALEHRWNPDALFVIFTAYFDESDTHGAMPTVIMGGFLGHAYQWGVFNRDLDRIRAEFGFRVFHTKKFKQKRGEFEGWDDDKCQRLINSLAYLTHRRLTEGVTVHLPRKRYLDEYRNLPFPPKMQPDSQYGLCFRGCLLHLLQIVGAKGRGRHTLHIVIEDGHPNIGDTQRVFREAKRTLASHGVEILGDITIALKSECKELMVADFLAHTYSMKRARNPLLLQQSPHQSEPEERPKGEAGLTYLDFTAETFGDFKVSFVREKQAGMDDWRIQRDARRAASSSFGLSA